MRPRDISFALQAVTIERRGCQDIMMECIILHVLMAELYSHRFRATPVLLWYGDCTARLTVDYADGVFYAELNEFFQRELAEEGYSGVEVRVTPTVTDISKSGLRRRAFEHSEIRSSHPSDAYPGGLR